MSLFVTVSGSIGSIVDSLPITSMMIYGAAVAFGFSAFWIFKARKEPGRARVMVPAFLVLGVLMFGFGQAWPSGWLIALGVMLFVLLAADMAMRSVAYSAKREADKKEKS